MYADFGFAFRGKNKLKGKRLQSHLVDGGAVVSIVVSQQEGSFPGPHNMFVWVPPLVIIA